MQGTIQIFNASLDDTRISRKNFLMTQVAKNAWQSASHPNCDSLLNIWKRMTFLNQFNYFLRVAIAYGKLELQCQDRNSSSFSRPRFPNSEFAVTDLLANTVMVSQILREMIQCGIYKKAHQLQKLDHSPSWHGSVFLIV